MTKLQLLKATTSLHGLAFVLGYKPKALSYLLYVLNDKAKYSTFSISKKSGGEREINAPTPRLLKLQRRLAEVLQACHDEIRESHGHKQHIAHGFVPGQSIFSNASQHVGKRFVFSVDLHDFFGTIHFGRVRGFLINNRDYGLNDKVATLIAKIACHNGRLPQGAPSSPVISNIIGHILDVRLAKLSGRCGCTYSRYADDLTFSCNKRVFPSELAVPSVHEWTLGRELLGAITKEGFVVNEKKTRMSYADSRQTVTGIVTNGKLNTRSEYRRHIRQMTHHLFNTGEFYLKKTTLDTGAVVEEKGTIPILEGMMSHVYATSTANYHRKNLPTSTKQPLSAYDRLYGNLRFFKDFYQNERPVLLMEGKTDNIYLRSALQRSDGRFPALAGKNGGKKTELNVTLYRFTVATGRLLNLHGGAGDLKNFISNLRRTANSSRRKNQLSPSS